MDTGDLIAVDKLWVDVFPYLAKHASELYGRTEGRVLELGPFAGGWSFALAQSHPSMTFTIAADHVDYLAYVRQKALSQSFSDRVRIVETRLTDLPFPDGSFDLVVLRGAFFLIVDYPQILSEIYRVLSIGGVGMVGGGFGRSIPQSKIDAISDESRFLNDKIGRRRVSKEQLEQLASLQGLEKSSVVSEEGGLWLVLNKRRRVMESANESLPDAIGVGQSECIALVGGGGKTNCMYRLARELANMGKSVITTTTTRIMKPTDMETPCLVLESEESLVVDRLERALAESRHVTFASTCDENGKLIGIKPEMVDFLWSRKMVDYIVNEADGSGSKPVKAPRQCEPVIPQSTTTVVALAGLDALGLPLSIEKAFRLECITRLTGIEQGDLMTEEVLATLLTHQRGVIQHSPSNARIVPFLNKADLVLPEKVEALASAILSRCHPQIKSVLSGALWESNPKYRIFSNLE